MARYWKESLLPGSQRDARGNWFSFSPADITAAHANVQKMLRRGVPIPCIFEHLNVEAGDPEEWKARYAKNTFGHVTNSRINSRGALEIEQEIPRTEHAQQAAVCRFVSPKVYRSYSDSRGGEYRGATIAHLSLTPTPVQFWQKPFELSRGEALYLSFEEPTVADEKKDDGKKGDSPGDGKEKTGIGAVIEALKSVGFAIPDEVTDEAGLVIAIKASGGPKAAAAGDDLGLGNPDGYEDAGKPPAGATASAGGAPMLMSDKRAAAWAKNDRKDLERRVRELFHTGRIDRPTAESLVRQVRAVELSYTRDGDLVPSRVQSRIDAYEDLPANQAWSPTGRRDAAELSDAAARLDPPASLAGGDGVAEVVREQERLAGMHSVARKK